MGTQSKPFDRLPAQHARHTLCKKIEHSLLPGCTIEHGKHHTFFSCRNFMWCAYAVGCGRLARRCSFPPSPPASHPPQGAPF